MALEDERTARVARARARRSKMTGEVVPLGTSKPPPYASSSPEERLAAAVRLIEYHEQLRGPRPPLPRSEWPGEAFIIGAEGG